MAFSALHFVMVILASTLKCSLCKALNFPVILETNCLINIITSNGIKSSQLLADFRFTHSYTLHDVNSLKLRILDGDTQPNLTTGYFRFSGKKRSSYSILFILLINSFVDTVKAIQNSGFRTSDLVTFFVKLHPTKTTGITRGFSNLVYFSALKAFHTNVVFWSETSSTIAILCYFCPDTKFISFPTRLTYNQIEKYSLSLNGNGYGRFVRVQLPYSMPGISIAYDVPACLNNFPAAKEPMEHILKVLKRCEYTEMIFLSPIQQVLNITITPSLISFPLEEWKTTAWFMQVVVAESIFQYIPVEIANTRGFIYTSRQDLGQKLVACVLSKDISHFDYNQISVVNIYVWTCLFSTVLMYGFVYKNVVMGFDLLLPLIGRSSCFNHLKLPFGLITISMLILSNSHQSCVSSDLMALSEFPDFQSFMKSGYSIGIQSMMVLVLPYLDMLLSAESLVVVKKEFSGRGIFDIFKPIVNSDAIENRSITYLLEEASDKKLMYASFAHPVFAGMYEVMGNKIWSVQDDYICKRFESQGIQLKASLRIWGYMSNRFYLIFSRWGEMGFLEKINRLWGVARLKYLRENVKMEAQESVQKEEKLTMWSVPGITCCILFGIEGCIISAHLTNYLCVRFYSIIKRLLSQIGKLRDRISNLLFYFMAKYLHPGLLPTIFSNTKN